MLTKKQLLDVEDFLEKIYNDLNLPKAKITLEFESGEVLITTLHKKDNIGGAK